MVWLNVEIIVNVVRFLDSEFRLIFLEDGFREDVWTSGIVTMSVRK